MLKTLLVRGMVVGVVAGFLAFGMAKIFGEPEVDLAIAFEEQMAAKEAAAAADAAAPAADATAGQSTAPAADASNSMAAMPGMAAEGGEEEELVSRANQSTWGLLTATLVYGASLGGIFALVYAYALGRFTGVSPRGLAGLLALAAFIAIAIAPDLKYPANPPASSNDDTIGPRTGLYLAMLLISIGAMVSAVLVGRGMTRKHGVWTGSLIGAGVYIVIFFIGQWILPDVLETPSDFPAVVLYRFRIANMGIEAVLWATMGLLFGYLTERSMQAGRRPVLRPAH
jgi:predicted cobalt transporter CbtA